MRVFHLYNKETLSNAGNSRMCPENHLSPYALPMRIEYKRSCMQFCFIWERVSYLLKKYVTDQALSKNVAAILRYVQPSNMARQRYTDDLIAKYCRDADLHDESTLADVFVEGIETFIMQSSQS